MRSYKAGIFGDKALFGNKIYKKLIEEELRYNNHLMYALRNAIYLDREGRVI